LVTVTYYVALSVILFTIGLVGVLVRRNTVLILMSVGLMLNAANLVLVAFAHHFDHLDGQIMALFVVVVAAVEAVVGLTLIVAVFKTKRSVDVDEIGSTEG
jgi:NADH-quinone oxidoreductase subunit K